MKKRQIIIISIVIVLLVIIALIISKKNKSDFDETKINTSNIEKNTVIVSEDVSETVPVIHLEETTKNSEDALNYTSVYSLFDNKFEKEFDKNLLISSGDVTPHCYTKIGLRDELGINLNNIYISDYRNRDCTRFMTFFYATSQNNVDLIKKTMDNYVKKVNTENNEYKTLQYGNYYIYILFPKENISDIENLINSFFANLNYK